MSQEIIDARDVSRVHRQTAVFQVPHQQPLAFECPTDPLADPAHQLLKRRHRRRHPAKAQAIARRHLHAVEKQQMEVNGCN